MTARAGWVYLVGAGPGDPGLITRRGLELLSTCEVVFYDRLVPPELLGEIGPEADPVYVGKEPGSTARPQSAIDAAIVAAARAGKAVVRLKGGDPVVFGRGADEAQALAAAGIPFEIVPGVSAATAVPAYAGIPITHGGVASSFAVMTGHEAGAHELPWGEMATGPDTLVLLMSVKGLADITARLIAAGRAREEPAAVIEWGTTPRQRTVVADLGSLAEAAAREGIRPPATAVIGKVVHLRDALNWFEARPLFGKRVVVTRARHQARDLAALLTELGADVVFAPTIEIADPSSFEEADRAVKELGAGRYAWVVFASTNAIERFFVRLTAAGFDARAFGRTRIAVVGRITARELAARGLIADLVPDAASAEGVVESLGEGAGVVLVPRVEGGPRAPLERLQQAGWSIDEVPVYRNVPATPDPAVLEALNDGRLDAITFTSGSTVRRFAEIYGDPATLGLAAPTGDVRVICIGPKTAEAAGAEGLRVDAIAAEQSAQGVAGAVRAALLATRKRPV